MGILSFFKKINELKCDWCKEKMQTVSHVKHVGTRRYNFCSASCKKNFRKEGYANNKNSCPTCAISR